MNPLNKRLLTLVGCVGVTWLLLAQFVGRMTDLERRDSAMPFGAATFAAYLLTIGYAVYYRHYWAEHRAPLGSEWPPFARWMTTLGVVAVVSVGLNVGFPDWVHTPAGQLLMYTSILGIIGVGLVITVTPPRPAPPEAKAGVASPAAKERPTFGAASLRVGAFQVYAFVAAVSLFAPIFLVMKGFETYVDVPACQQRCQRQGYIYDRLIIRKGTYDCNCRGSDGFHTFHERAHIGGGTGVWSAIFDWVVRTATVLAVFAAWVMALLGVVHWVSSREPDSAVARLYRAAARLVSPAQAAPETPTTPDVSAGRRRRKRR